MGGNVRYAAKGPDRSKSTCGACGTEFTHGKFSHPSYCESCREDRRDPDDIRTELTADVDTSLRSLSVTVRIVNDNDVPYRDIPVSYDNESRASVIGYLRVEATDGGCAAETAWIEEFRYKKMKLRENNTREKTFTWKPGTGEESSSFRQESLTVGEHNRDSFDEFLQTVEMVQGVPFDADELTVEFIPGVDCDELDSASTTLTFSHA